MPHHFTDRIRIKRIDTLDMGTVWLVDGGKIRKELNENFVQSGSKARFPFIPTGEFWIDINTDPREHRFFIDRFFAEETLLKAGIPLDTARTAADTLERHEREQALSARQAKLRSHRNSLIEKIHRKRFPPYTSDALNIWIVDGKLVRDTIFLDYDAGGHDRVYPWIPKQEVWIEEALSERERPFILLHELHERFLMGTGKNYQEAHQGATIVEDRLRDHPASLHDRIQEEIARNIQNPD